MFKQWLFYSGPIGRLLQWMAEPGRRIAQRKIDEIFAPYEFPESYSGVLEPGCDTTTAETYREFVPDLDDQDRISPL